MEFASPSQLLFRKLSVKTTLKAQEQKMAKYNSFSTSFLTGINTMEHGMENGFKVMEFTILPNKIYSIEDNSRVANNMAKVLFFVNL